MTRKNLYTVLFWFVISEALVISCVLLGPVVLGRQNSVQNDGGSLLLPLWNADGQCFIEIAEDGYRYEIGEPSYVAHFPGYPLAIWVANGAFGIPLGYAAAAIANASVLGAMLLFAAYSIHREKPAAWHQAVAVIAVFPTTFFFRMAYSESLFLVVCVAAMLGIAKSWSPWKVALIVGAATGIRPVGVAALFPLALYGWKTFINQPRKVAKTLGLILAGSWGLLAYMAYQHLAFGDALAFAKTQAYYRVRADLGIADEILAYGSWEPIWSVYEPRSPAYWANRGPPGSPLINLNFANPIIFLAIVFCVGIGAWKRWLTQYEVALSFGLLAIPYVTRAYEMGMVSHGRFAAICFPCYFVIGELFRRAGNLATVVLLGLSIFYLCAYSMLFGAGYELN